MNVLHFTEIVGILRMKSVREDPRESIKCFLEEPWLGVNIIQGLLVLVVKFLPKTQKIFNKPGGNEGKAALPEILILIFIIRIMKCFGISVGSFLGGSFYSDLVNCGVGSEERVIFPLISQIRRRAVLYPGSFSAISKVNQRT